MKLLAVVLAFVTLSLMVVNPALAHNGEDCSHDAATISALRDCVQHAVDMAHIDNPGIANSLFAKLDAAQAAVDRSQPSAAVNQLKAFVKEVKAQAGKHIAAEHAEHLQQHAGLVIQALGG